MNESRPAIVGKYLLTAAILSVVFFLGGWGVIVTAFSLEGSPPSPILATILTVLAFIFLFPMGLLIDSGLFAGVSDNALISLVVIGNALLWAAAIRFVIHLRRRQAKHNLRYPAPELQ